MIGAIINKWCAQRVTTPSDLKKQEVPEEMANSRSCAIIVQDRLRISSYSREWVSYQRLQNVMWKELSQWCYS